MKTAPAVVRQLTLALIGAAPLFAAEKPNILFIIADDLGIMDLAIYNSPFYRTPHLDQLAKDGLRFENSYAAHPRCVGSRYGIMSGRLPARDGVPGKGKDKSPHHLPLERVTFAEVLKEQGYRTGYIGKWHLGKKGGFPSQQGFEDSRIAGSAGAPASYFYPYHVSKRSGHKTKEEFPEVTGNKGEHLTRRLTKEALDFFSEKDSRPFLLTLAYYAVHTPFEAPEDSIALYQKTLKTSQKKNGGTSDDHDFKNSDQATDKTEQNNPIYAAMVHELDQSIGKITAALAEHGLEKNTVIIFTSDHGGLSTRGINNKRPLATSNLPYRHGKGWLYDGGLRVPHIVKWPGTIQPGTLSKTQTHGVDHYATILDLAQAPHPSGLDSHSYLPVLKAGRPATTRSPLFFYSPRARPSSTGDRNAAAIIDGEWKLIEHHEPRRYELYHLPTDPGEKKNLAEEKPSHLNRLKKALLSTKKELKVIPPKSK